MDLLEYAQALVARGHTTHNAHTAYLQELVSQESPQKAEVRTTLNNSPKISNNTHLLIVGLILFGVAVLAIGY
jgi:hypothetical protein